MPDGLDFRTLPRWCVFTEADVVRRGLDASGWTRDADLSKARLLEPAAGDGAFVVEAARRLVTALRARKDEVSYEILAERITAFEIEPRIIAVLRANVVTALVDEGVGSGVAARLASHWCREADFLSAEQVGVFTHAAGNPPFLRGGGSAPDVCVSFIERSFGQLTEGGRMAMLAPLALGSATGARRMRAAIERDGYLEAIEPYEPSEAFVRRVAVRGALFVAVRKTRTSSGLPDDGAMWLAGSEEARRVFHEASARFPTLEQAGCRIRLGMATGRNSVFVRAGSSLDVEEDLLVPAVSTRDLSNGAIAWKGLSVIDTARPDGKLWTLQEKPRLHAYLEAHRETLEGRHSVASGGFWQQTHTRLSRRLAAAPKILVAETANPCRVAMDGSGFMPLNSLHAIESSEWPLEPLATLLNIAAVGLVANALLLTRGKGYLRVNATALRKVRIPPWRLLGDIEKRKLQSENRSEACEAVACIFRMSDNLLRQCTGCGRE